MRKKISGPPIQGPVPIVGVGASAGGLEAFRQLLKALPGHTGLEMTLRHRLGTGSVEIFSPAGLQLVSHTLAPPGCGASPRASRARTSARASRS